MLREHQAHYRAPCGKLAMLLRLIVCNSGVPLLPLCAAVASAQDMPFAGQYSRCAHGQCGSQLVCSHTTTTMCIPPTHSPVGLCGLAGDGAHLIQVLGLSSTIGNRQVPCLHVDLANGQITQARGCKDGWWGWRALYLCQCRVGQGDGHQHETWCTTYLVVLGRPGVGMHAATMLNVAECTKYIWCRPSCHVHRCTHQR